MPRGVKGNGKLKVTKSIEERIASIDAQIESLQAQLASAKAKRKDLIQQQKQSEYEAVQKVIQDSGLTAAQLKELIEGNK